MGYSGKKQKSGCLYSIVGAIFVTGCILAIVNLIIFGDFCPPETARTEAVADSVSGLFWIFAPIMYALYHIVKSADKQEIERLEQNKTEAQNNIQDLQEKRISTLNSLKNINKGE